MHQKMGTAGPSFHRIEIESWPLASAALLDASCDMILLALRCGLDVSIEMDRRAFGNWNQSRQKIQAARPANASATTAPPEIPAS